MNPNKRVIIVSGARTIRARAHRGTGFGAFKRCYLGFRFKQREIAKKRAHLLHPCAIKRLLFRQMMESVRENTASKVKS